LFGLLRKLQWNLHVIKQEKLHVIVRRNCLCVIKIIKMTSECP